MKTSTSPFIMNLWLILKFQFSCFLAATQAAKLETLVFTNTLASVLVYPIILRRCTSYYTRGAVIPLRTILASRFPAQRSLHHMTLNTATVDPQPSATTLQPIVARKELLNGRYDVGPLLGSGRWSQTYLVKDIQCVRCLRCMSILLMSQPSYHRSSTIAATKIYSDYATSEGVEKGHIREVQVLERIKEVALDDNLPLLKDHFFHTSASDKKHLCLVLPVFCESVDAWRKKCPGKVLDLQVVKEIIALVLQGLIQLHARGIIHTGMFALPCRRPLWIYI